MINLYVGMALLFLLGMVSGMMIMIIRSGHKQKKIDSIVPVLPDYDPANPINGGSWNLADEIKTEYGTTLYRIHSQGV